MNAFQTIGDVVQCEMKRDSAVVTLTFDDTSPNQQHEEPSTPGTPLFVGRFKVRLRKGVLGRMNQGLLEVGQRIEVNGFIQGLERVNKEGEPSLDLELIAVRVVPAALSGNRSPK